MSCAKYFALCASAILFAGLGGCATPVAIDKHAVPPSVQSSEGNVVKQEDTADPRARRSFERALSLLKTEKNTQAEAELQKLIRDFPDLPGPRANLGMLYLRLGRLPQAEEALMKAIQLSPEEAVYYNQLGILLRQSGRFKEARKAYGKAIALNPNYSNAHFNMAILFDIYLRDADKAQFHYLRYQSLLPAEDKLVTKWIIDLKQRTQAAGKPPAKGDNG